MRKLRWQILIVVLALGAIAVLLYTQQGGQLLPIVEEPQPASGGIYTEGLVGSPGRLNPLLDSTNSADRDINRLIFSSLIRFDARGIPQLDLAESMGVKPDGLIYNFTLREGVTWHDGKPLTAEDIIFTIDLMRSDDLPIPEDIRELWKSVEVEILDEKTLQFRLPEPFSPFMDYLAFGVLPRHLLSDVEPAQLPDSDFHRKPVGSGPYQFDRWLVEGDQITGLVLRSFKDYYAEPPFIEQFVIRYFPDSQSALAAYQAGEVMGVSQISRAALPAALREPNLSLNTGRLPQLTLVFLNLGNPELPFFQDLGVRRALLNGLNRQRMIDNLLAGQAIIADGPIFPGSWAHYEGIERLPYDPDLAVKLLKEAGYTIPAEGGTVRAKEDVRLSFELLYPEGEEYQGIAEAIARDWGRLGVEVELRALPYEQLVTEHLEPREYEAVLVDLNLMRSPDPDPYPFWHQAMGTGGQNYARWDDRQASEYLEGARVSVDLEERTRLYRNFQVRFTSEMPALPLFYPVYTYAVDSQVQGLTMGPLFDTSDRFATVTKWFLVADRGEPEAAETTPAAPSDTEQTGANP